MLRRRDRGTGCADGQVVPAEATEIHGRVQPLADEWEALADRVGASPFERPGWVELWWQSFADGELEIVALRRGGALAAVVPLARSRGSLRTTTNWHSVSSGILAEDQGAARALVEAALRRTRGSLTIAFLDPAGSELAACRGAAAGLALRTLVRPYQRSPYLDIDGDWARYEQGLSKNVRSDVRRRRRRLEEQGRVSIEVGDGGSRLDALLEEGYAVEASGWKGERGTAIASEEATRHFYSGLAHWAAERGWLRLAFLRLDDRPLAFQLNLESGGVHYHLKGGYDATCERFSPGKVLHQALLERAFTEGIRRYEFLGENDPYKLQWASGVSELVLFQAFAKTPAGFADWLAYARLRPVARRVLASIRRS